MTYLLLVSFLLGRSYFSSLDKTVSGDFCRTFFFRWRWGGSIDGTERCINVAGMKLDIPEDVKCTAHRCVKDSFNRRTESVIRLTEFRVIQSGAASGGGGGGGADGDKAALNPPVRTELLGTCDLNILSAWSSDEAG